MSSPWSGALYGALIGLALALVPGEQSPKDGKDSSTTQKEES